MAWQVQEAKQRLSELLADAREHPQTITRHGRPYAVVLSAEAYDRLVGRDDFKDFLRSAPDLDDLPPRDVAPAREVDL
jgi:antitoxin Phd